MIDRIAIDLGVYRFAEEPLSQYTSRVIYSAMACWIKAIAQDKPVGYQENAPSGISRRHIFERSHTILGTMIKMFPEIKEWFDLSAENDDPVNLVRTRLINHGDLLNVGYGSNLTLSSVHSCQVTSTLETVYGKTIEDGLLYSGIASLRYKEASGYNPEIENVKEWMKSYLGDVFWSHDLPDPSQVQYFNPLSSAKNNYEAWQESLEKKDDKVVLIRTAVNKNSYVYYLLKPNEKIVHRIDPFLQEQGFHIKAMCALRSQSKNNTTATVTKYNNHIKIRLNAILPLRESIMMESYAWPVKRINDRLEWVMGFSVWNHIRPYIEALDIHIMEEEHG